MIRLMCHNAEMKFFGNCYSYSTVKSPANLYQLTNFEKFACLRQILACVYLCKISTMASHLAEVIGNMPTTIANR